MKNLIKKTKQTVQNILGDKRKKNDFDLNGMDFDMNMDFDMSTNFDTTKPYDIEKKSKQMVGERLKQIREQEKKWLEKLVDEIDMNFYFQVVFKNSTDLEKFKEETGIELHYDDFIFFEDFMKKMDIFYRKKYTGK